MILHVREIPECLDSYKTLPIDRVYFTGFTEKQLEDPVNEFIQTTNYDHYWVISDDGTAPREAFDLIAQGLKREDVVTGYSMNPDGSGNVSLCDEPLKDRVPTGLKSYHWMSKAKLDAYPDNLVPTYYAPFALTAMKRDIWLEVPYGAYSFVPVFLIPYLLSVRPARGFACDYHLSWRLQKKGIKVYAAKGALIEHFGGSVFGKSVHHLNLGEVTPSVELVKCGT
jgi:hypothetical protein